MHLSRTKRLEIFVTVALVGANVNLLGTESKDRDWHVTLILMIANALFLLMRFGLFDTRKHWERNR